MSDPGFPSLPAGPNISGPSAPGPKIEPNARIVGSPPELQDLKKSVEINGKVVGENQDGSVRIRTAQGDIDVQPTDRRLKLRSGEDVKVEIPPGSPPRGARISEDKGAAQPQPRQVSQGTSSPPPDSAVRTSETPVDIYIRPETPPPETPGQPAEESPAPAAGSQTGNPPGEEKLVRLLPLTLADVAKELRPALPQVISNFLPPIPPETQIVVSETVAAPASPLSSVASDISPATMPAALQIVDAQPQKSLLQTVKSALVSVLPLSPTAAAAPPVPAGITESLATTLPAVSFASPPPALLKIPAAVFSALPPAVSLLAPAAAQPSPALNQGTQIQNILTPLQAADRINLPVLQTLLPSSQPALTEAPATSITTPLPLENSGTPPLPQAFNARLTAGGNALAQQSPVGIAPSQNIESAFKKLPLLERFHLQNAPPLILQNNRIGNLAATVIGHTQKNTPVLALWPRGNEAPLLFSTTIPLEGAVIGQQVTVLPATGHFTAVIVPGALMPPPVPAYLLTAEPWPAMQDIYTGLAQALPAAAQSMAAMTPSPAAAGNIPATALFFMAAIKGGDLNQWLGERAVEMLRRAGRGGLLSRLSQEGSALNRMASEPVSQDWRALTLPMMWDNQIHKIALYYKQDRQSDEDQNNQPGGQTRFVFDINFDQLGQVQLDGLFKEKRLDLIIRTQQAFSTAMQTEMREIYDNSLSQLSLAGDISFQNKSEQWVTIKPDRSEPGIFT